MREADLWLRGILASDHTLSILGFLLEFSLFVEIIIIFLRLISYIILTDILSLVFIFMQKIVWIWSFLCAGGALNLGVDSERSEKTVPRRKWFKIISVGVKLLCSNAFCIHQLSCNVKPFYELNSSAHFLCKVSLWWDFV